MALTLVAKARFPTRHGDFTIVGFRNATKEHVALVRGDVEGRAAVPVRVHSQCLTGDTLGSLRCDCRDQLDQSLALLARREDGILVYLAQEGRGIGLANKIAAYALQDAGRDTIEANEDLGFAPDLRDYADAAEMLKLLGVASIDLLTNNPAKVEGIEQHGVKVAKRTPLAPEPTPHNHGYLETKKRKAGHVLDEGARATTKAMLGR